MTCEMIRPRRPYMIDTKKIKIVIFDDILQYLPGRNLPAQT